MRGEARVYWRVDVTFRQTATVVHISGTQAEDIKDILSEKTGYNWIEH